MKYAYLRRIDNYMKRSFFIKIKLPDSIGLMNDNKFRFAILHRLINIYSTSLLVILNATNIQEEYLKDYNKYIPFSLDEKINLDDNKEIYSLELSDNRKNINGFYFYDKYDKYDDNFSGLTDALNYILDFKSKDFAINDLYVPLEIIILLVILLKKMNSNKNIDEVFDDILRIVSKIRYYLNINRSNNIIEQKDYRRFQIRNLYLTEIQKKNLTGLTLEEGLFIPAFMYSLGRGNKQPILS